MVDLIYVFYKITMLLNIAFYFHLINIYIHYIIITYDNCETEVLLTLTSSEYQWRLTVTVFSEIERHLVFTRAIVETGSDILF